MLDNEKRYYAASEGSDRFAIFDHNAEKQNRHLVAYIFPNAVSRDFVMGLLNSHEENKTQAVDSERVAQLIAHRACCGVEHDPGNGKLHGYCIVCGVPWPCAYAGTPSEDSNDGKVLVSIDGLADLLTEKLKDSLGETRALEIAENLKEALRDQ